MACALRSGCPGLLLGLLLATRLASAGDASELATGLADFGIDATTSVLLVRRLDGGEEWCSNDARADTRFVPASTSKIPHTLIALETRFVTGPDAFFEWDGTERAFAQWNQDQTLATAYQRSAVWVYQRIAAGVGGDTMGAWLARFDYGNHDVGGAGNVTTYWLEGPLAISAREQVDFLARLARRELPLSTSTYEQARGIMQADAGDGWTLYAKTGWAMRRGDVDLGWYVGWVERDDDVYVFAFNLDMPDESYVAKRVPAVRAMLSRLKILPPTL